MQRSDGYDSEREGPMAVATSLEIPGEAIGVPLEEVLERSVGKDNRSSTRLASGRLIELREVARGEDVVTVRSPSGEVELEVRLTDQGPVLRFKSADVEWVSSGRVTVDCAQFHVRASEGIVEETDGDHQRRVGGEVRSRVRGELHEEAHTVNIRARRGDVRVKANDDVRLNGERVKLNCALPTE